MKIYQLNFIARKLISTSAIRKTNIDPIVPKTVSAPPPRVIVNDEIKQYYNRTKLWNYNVNYVKVGHGPHAVFCYPGILGAMRTHLTQLIHNFEKYGDIYTFYAWDQPGYGQSRPPKREFGDKSLQEDADMSFELLKKFGHDKYSLLGWSGGGLSALLFSIQNPELVRKLVVWGVFSYVDQEDADMFRWFRNTSNWGGIMQDVLIQEYGQEFFEESWVTWMDILIRLNTNNNGEFCANQLHKITCPTFILHGKKDKIVLPKHAHYLHKNIPNSKLLIMEEGKHNIQIRYQEEFFKQVHQFLQE